MNRPEGGQTEHHESSAPADRENRDGMRGRRRRRGRRGERFPESKFARPGTEAPREAPRTDRSETERTERTSTDRDRSERSDRPERSERTARPERSDRSARPERSERSRVRPAAGVSAHHSAGRVYLQISAHGAGQAGATERSVVCSRCRTVCTAHLGDFLRRRAAVRRVTASA